jgi:PadR family transcriptional regulator
VVEQGALYPALSRLEERGLLASEWGVSANNRRAKFYRLTRRGEKGLREQTEGWKSLSAAIGMMLAASRPDEA